MKRHVLGVRRGEVPPRNGVAIGSNFNTLDAPRQHKRHKRQMNISGARCVGETQDQNGLIPVDQRPQDSGIDQPRASSLSPADPGANWTGASEGVTGMVLSSEGARPSLPASVVHNTTLSTIRQ